MLVAICRRMHSISQDINIQQVVNKKLKTEESNKAILFLIPIRFSLGMFGSFVPQCNLVIRNAHIIKPLKRYSCSYVQRRHWVYQE